MSKKQAFIALHAYNVQLAPYVFVHLFLAIQGAA